MQGLPITSLFAAVYAIVFILLALQVIQQRGAVKAAYGDGGDTKLRHFIRAQGNFAEYVPFFLILSGLNELAGMNANLLYLLNFVMLYGRISHAYGLSIFELNNPADEKALRFRKTGMQATFAAMSLSALLLIVHALR